MNNPITIKARASASIAAVAATFLVAPTCGFAQTAPAVVPRQVQVPAKPKPVQALPAQPGSQAATQGAASGREPIKPSGGDDVVARVGDANVSADDIRGYIAALGPREQAALAQDPALLNQAVRMLLANRLVLQEVLAKKWDQQPNVVAQLDRLREGALVELYLQSVSTPPAD